MLQTDFLSKSSSLIVAFALHVVAFALHVVAFALHVVAFALHVVAFALHVVAFALHVVAFALHDVAFALALEKNSLFCSTFALLYEEVLQQVEPLSLRGEFPLECPR